MWGNIATNLVVKMLRSSKLSIENRSKLTSSIVDKLEIVPLRDIIMVNDDKNLVVNGRVLERDQVLRLRDSARSAKENLALNFVRDQVIYEALLFGVNKSNSSEQLYFMKAAIWWGQQEDRLLKLLTDYGQARELTPQ